MNDLSLSLLISIALTLPLALIQIFADSKLNRLNSLFTPQLGLYLFISSLGNLISTLLAAGIIDHALINKKANSYAQLLEGPKWIWYTFFGVFAFQALIKQINISIYGKGVLAIDDWSKKSKNTAVAAALKKAAGMEAQETENAANRLYVKFQPDPSHIHTIADNHLGTNVYKKIIKDMATKPNINVELRLCYLLATKFPLIVKGILAQKKAS